MRGSRAVRQLGLLGVSFFVLAIGPASRAREVRISILHTAEVGGHLYALPYREHEAHAGGLLKAASVVEACRADHPTLLFDTGGMLSGSAESELTQGELPAKAVAWLGYDARLPDGSDWNADPGRLTTLGPLVLSNARSIPAELRVSGAVAPFHVIDVEGIRVGVLALQEVPAPIDSGVILAMGADGEANVAEALQALRAQSPQILVLLLRADPEAGPVRDRARTLARRFPEIDVILGAGDGEAVRCATWNQTVFNQAGREARWVGRVDLVYDTVRRERTAATANLIEVGEDVPESRELRRALGRDIAAVAWELDRVVGRSTRALEGTSRWPGQSGVQRLVSEAMRAATDAEVVLLEKQAQAALAEGPVRIRDVFRVLPRTSRLVTVDVTAAELRQILEENGAMLGTDEFLGCHGIDYAYRASAPRGARIEDLRLEDGTRPHGRRRLRVAFHAHLLETGGEARAALRRIAAQPESRLRAHAVDTRQALMKYLAAHGEGDLRPAPGLRPAS